MTSPAKLSLISTYQIRKIILANQNQLIIKQELTDESPLNLDKILTGLYLKKSKLEHQINQLEILARMHQVLVNQKAIYGTHEIESQIFGIFGLKSKSA